MTLTCGFLQLTVCTDARAAHGYSTRPDSTASMELKRLLALTPEVMQVGLRV